jgi:hypothetical protein
MSAALSNCKGFLYFISNKFAPLLKKKSPRLHFVAGSILRPGAFKKFVSLIKYNLL